MKFKKTSWTVQSFTRMYGTQTQSFSSQGTRMDHLWKSHKKKGSTYFRTTMSRETHGTIGFTRPMTPKDWYSFLGGRISLLVSWKNCLIDHFTGIRNGCRIRITGPGMSMTCFQCGFSLLWIEAIWRRSIPGKYLRLLMELMARDCREMMIMGRCRLGLFGLV